MEEKTLGSKIVSGSIWTVLMRTSIRFIGIISTLILARILTPEDFGIVAKATMIYGFLEMLSQFGLENALIKNQNASKDDYNTVWTLSILRAIVIGVILIISAVPLSTFFHEPQLDLIIITYGFISILRGFINVGIVDFRKEMNFSLDFKFNFYNKLISFIATMVIAYTYETYWALVIGAFVSTLSALIFGYILSRRRPSLSLSKWRELFHFSKWVFGFELINAISSKLDMFILSRYSTSQNVGLYTVSYEIAATPSTEISMPIARATLPGLSKLNHDSDDFRKMYVSIISMVIFIATPASLGLYAIADIATLALLGDKWIDASIFIEILALFGLARVTNATSVSAYMAYNKPDLLAKISTVNLVLRIILLPLGMYFGGVIGLCWSIVLAALIYSTINLYIQSTIGMLRLMDIIKSVYKSVFSSIVMLYVLVYSDLSVSASPVLELFLNVIVGIVVFTTMSILLYNLLSAPDSPEEKIYRYIRNKI